jgi:carbonic anhydrase/acetyltransferase-like protein (isoleucine patch superfamily)
MSAKEGVPVGGKKYELLLDQQVVVAGMPLYRIRALKDFGTVKAGALGGFVASERNLSQHGECWVADDAWVYEEAVISNGAQVRGRGCVHGHARISDRGQVLGNAEVFDHAWVFKRGAVFDNAKVFGRGQVRDDGLVYGNAIVCDRARVLGHGQVCGDTRLDARIVVNGREKDGPFSSSGQPSARGRGRPRSPRGPHP